MIIDKRQQSFSSYSEGENKQDMIQDDQFSQYQQPKLQKCQNQQKTKQTRSNCQKNPIKKTTQTQQKLSHLTNLLNPPITQPFHHLSSHNSPYNLNAYTSHNVHSNYFSNHNYNVLKLGHSFSIDKTYNNEKILDRSEFWNGNKFDYFGHGASQQSKTLKLSKQQNTLTQQSKLFKQNKKDIYFERIKNSGVIVNKNHIQIPNKNHNQISNNNIGFAIKNHTIHSKSSNMHNSNDYIKIQQDISNKKNMESNKKQTLKYQKRQIKVINQNKVLHQKQAKQNILKTNNQNKPLIDCQYKNILSQNTRLNNELLRVNTLLKAKDLQIQSLSSLRLRDLDQYSLKLSELTKLFQTQKQTLVSTLFQQTNKLSTQNQALTPPIQNNSQQKTQLLTKIQQQKEQIQKLKGDIEIIKKKENIPKWIASFLKVFQDMIRKLPIQVDQQWNSKKVVIVGWRVLKKVVEKAVKIGIKMPHIVTNQIEDQSILQPANYLARTSNYMPRQYQYHKK